MSDFSWRQWLRLLGCRTHVRPIRSRVGPRFRPLAEALEDRRTPATIVVTTTADTVADDGFTSLREAIQQANAAPGLDTIAFNLAADDPGHVYYTDDSV